MRSKEPGPDAAHELEVIDAVVRGGGHARPEDAALTDFALLVRNARPLPDHGAAIRLDERLTSEQPERRQVRRPLLLAALASFVVIAVVGGVALNGGGPQDFSQPSAEPHAGQVTTPADSAGGSVSGPAVPEGQKRKAFEDLTDSKAMQSGVSKGAAMVAQDREVARDARLTLATPGARIERLSDRVVETVDDARGYVANSSVRSGQGDRGRADFRLMLPAAGFQETFAALSKLAHVRSRSQSTEDITADYRASERVVRQREARVAALETKLDAAETPATRQATRRDLERAKFALRQAERGLRVNKNRVQFVPVELKIVADSAAATADQGTIGKAVSRAGEILTNIAAVMIVMLAVGIPVAIASALALLGYRRWRRTRADRTIGGAAAQPE